MGSISHEKDYAIGMVICENIPVKIFPTQIPVTSDELIVSEKYAPFLMKLSMFGVTEVFLLPWNLSARNESIMIKRTLECILNFIY